MNQEQPKRWRKWADANPERLKELKTRWNKKNADRCRLYAFRGALKKHGMTMEDYKTILQKQNGVCAICLKPCKVRTRLAIDHDHETGQVRGLLCNGCNVAIGHLNEDPNMFYRAMDYLGISGRHHHLEIVIDPLLSKVVEAANDASYDQSGKTTGAKAA